MQLKYIYIAITDKFSQKKTEGIDIVYVVD